MNSKITRPPRENTLSAVEVFGAIGLIALQLAIAFVFTAILFLLSFNMDSCAGSGTCNYQVAAASLYMTLITAVVTVLLSIVLTIVFTRRGQPAYFYPVIGNIAVALVGVVAIILNLTSLS